MLNTVCAVRGVQTSRHKVTLNIPPRPPSPLPVLANAPINVMPHYPLPGTGGGVQGDLTTPLSNGPIWGQIFWSNTLVPP